MSPNENDERNETNFGIPPLGFAWPKGKRLNKLREVIMVLVNPPMIFAWVMGKSLHKPCLENRAAANWELHLVFDENWWVLWSSLTELSE